MVKWSRRSPLTAESGVRSPLAIPANRRQIGGYFLSNFKNRGVMMIKYVSTRGSEKVLTGAQAIIAGIADDRGLYLPTSIPTLASSLEDMADMDYRQIAKSVLAAFLTDYTEDEINSCVEKAYDEKFDNPEIVPIVKKDGVHFLELYHGSTSAFKDMALSILPHLLTTAMKKEGEDKKICILTATSGDTGKAALAGFADVENTEIIVFFPNNGVSAVQEKQMTTQEGSNVHVYAIEGNFDDAQSGVKQIFADDDFAAELAQKGYKLSSANSINIGRLLPQIAYYVYGYAQLVKNGEISAGEEVNVVVPTGNFGNILAAYLAKLIGVPFAKFICASNQNRVLTDFFEWGVYDKNRMFYLTNSPSMDILISSNLERLLYLLAGGNTEEVRYLMDSLEESGRYDISDEMRERLCDFYGGSCDTEETETAIKKMYEENGYLIDTHTAVAYKVYCDYREKTGDSKPVLLASTASAYKFAESVGQAIGINEELNGFDFIKKINKMTEVAVPEGLKDLESKKVLHDEIIRKTQMIDAVRNSLI